MNKYEDEEILDIINNKGEIIGSMPRFKIHGNPALIHRVVHVLVFNKSGDLFLQKRSMNKDVAPGKWDTSVGGHVNHGETIHSAIERETMEELGITLPQTKFLYEYIHSNSFETELVHTFFSIYDDEIIFNRSEIEEVRTWSINEIKDALGKGILSDNFEHEFKMLSSVFGCATNPIMNL